MNNPYHFCRLRTARLIQIAVLIGLTSPAFSASFDCAKASSPVEKLICPDRLLNKLDEALGKNYSYLLKSAPDDAEKKDIRDRQRSWVIGRNKCADISCLIEAYKDRLDDMCPTTPRFGKDPDCLDFNDVAGPQQAAQATKPPTAPPTATAATSPSEDKRKHLSALVAKHSASIKSLGFSTSFLNGTIYLQADAFNRPIAYGKFSDWLALLFESGNYSNITKIGSGQFQGIQLKRTGMQSAGLLFLLDGGDLFPSHIVTATETERLTTVEDRIAVAMMISQSVK